MSDLIPLEQGRREINGGQALISYIYDLWDYNPDFIKEDCDAIQDEINDAGITDPSTIKDMYVEEYEKGLNSGLPCVEYFSNPTFNTLVFDFIKEQGKDPRLAIRGYLPDKNNANCFYMQHGVGYAWMSEDLLGGTADGTMGRKFEDYLRTKGFSCSQGII